MDRPPFKVMGEATLMELVLRAPIHAKDLQGISGMTPKQIHHHRHGLLHAIQEGLHGPPQQLPQVDPESDDVVDRYHCLHTWRKKRARRAVWSWMSSFRARRSGIWLVGLRVPTANWRTSQTLVSGGGKGTGKRFWRYCLGPHREPAGGLRLQVHPKLQQ